MNRLNSSESTLFNYTFQKYKNKPQFINKQDDKAESQEYRYLTTSSQIIYLEICKLFTFLCVA